MIRAASKLCDSQQPTIAIETNQSNILIGNVEGQTVVLKSSIGQ